MEAKRGTIVPPTEVNSLFGSTKLVDTCGRKLCVSVKKSTYDSIMTYYEWNWPLLGPSLIWANYLNLIQSSIHQRKGTACLLDM